MSINNRFKSLIIVWAEWTVCCLIFCFFPKWLAVVTKHGASEKKKDVMECFVFEKLYRQVLNSNYLVAIFYSSLSWLTDVFWKPCIKTAFQVILCFLFVTFFSNFDKSFSTYSFFFDLYTIQFSHICVKFLS